MENKLEEQTPTPKPQTATLHLRTAVRAGSALDVQDQDADELFGEDEDLGGL